MPDAAQYTLALFDTTALGWTVDIPRPENLSPDPVLPIADAIADAPPAATVRPVHGTNYVLAGERELARGWAARARQRPRHHALKGR